MKKFFVLLSCISLLMAIAFLGLSIYENEKLTKEQDQIGNLMNEVFINETVPEETKDETQSPSETTGESTPETTDTTGTTETSKPTQTETNTKPQYTTPAAVNVAELKKTNSDIQGWIYLENSNVNYPFVHSTGNEYLRKNIYGKKSDAGTIFCYDNQEITSYSKMDKNVILYGHNMNNGTMFYYIDYLRRNTNSLKTGYNKYIYIYTENYIYKYEIFSVYKIEKDENFNQVYFKNDVEFTEFCTSLYQRSVYKGTCPDFSGKNIITLATCTSGSSKTHRTALHGILVEVKENDY